MTPDRWTQVEALFLEAVEQPQDSQAAFLAERCASDPGLRTEVEALLADHDHGSSFLETPAFEGLLAVAGALRPSNPAAGAAPGEPAPADAVVGRLVGPYRLVRRIATGGMGVVYEAEQADPRRAVALKIIRSGPYADEQTLRLFRREIQSLARLKHPAIAAIYEAGRTKEGQHYFAMELVDGQPLDAYVRQHPLSIRERLALFLRLCDGVGYAHQRGVIHRDLKPANVLVGDGVQAGAGESAKALKILDFGLARITDTEAPGVSQVTAAGQVRGTLAYMSPEQARGDAEAVDVRSDVYSLGVMLYELLTGQLPYAVGQTSLLEALQVICAQAPQRPSALDRALRGDLETIVLKALQKDVEQRYPSVAGLAADIERYLAQQPISARPASAFYRFRKHVARHKTRSALITTVLVFLAALGINAQLQAHAIAHERDQARASQSAADHEARLAEQVGDFTEKVLRRMLATVSARGAAGDGATLVELVTAVDDALRVELAGQPEIEARVRDKIGNAYWDSGLGDEAQAQFEAALTTRRAQLGDRHPEIISRLYGLGNLLGAKQDYPAAQARIQEGLELGRQSAGDNSLLVAAGLTRLAGVVSREGHPDAAESLRGQAVAIRLMNLYGHADGPPGAVSGPPSDAPAVSVREFCSLQAHGQPRCITQDRATGDFLVAVARDSGATGGLVRVTRAGTSALLVVSPLFSSAIHICQDPRTADVVITDQSGRLVRVDSAGHVSVLAFLGNGRPCGVVCRDSGDLIVTNAWSGFGLPAPQWPTGLVTVHASGAWEPLVQGWPFEFPRAVIADADGVTVLDADFPGLLQVPRSGRVVAKACGPPFCQPRGIARDALTDDLLVTDFSSEHGPVLLRVTAAGAVSTVYSGEPFQDPGDLCPDQVSGDFIVVDQAVPTLWRVVINR